MWNRSHYTTSCRLINPNVLLCAYAVRLLRRFVVSESDEKRHEQGSNLRRQALDYADDHAG